LGKKPPTAVIEMLKNKYGFDANENFDF